jgi:hypothetical protein
VLPDFFFRFSRERGPKSVGRERSRPRFVVATLPLPLQLLTSCVDLSTWIQSEQSCVQVASACVSPESLTSEVRCARRDVCPTGSLGDFVPAQRGQAEVSRLVPSLLFFIHLLKARKVDLLPERNDPLSTPFASLSASGLDIREENRQLRQRIAADELVLTFLAQQRGLGLSRTSPSSRAEGSHSSASVWSAPRMQDDLRDLLAGMEQDFFRCPVNTCLSPCPSSWTMYVLGLSFGVAFCLDRATDVLWTQVPGAVTSFVRRASSACSASCCQGVLCAGGALPVSRAATG